MFENMILARSLRPVPILEGQRADEHVIESLISCTDDARFIERTPQLKLPVPHRYNINVVYLTSLQSLRFPQGCNPPRSALSSHLPLA